jgi:GNAT superfamily N-acetyltransferase
MNFHIIPFPRRHLKPMAQLFMKEYSEPGCQWNSKTAQKYLQRNLDSHPQYCFAAVDKNVQCLGGIFCRLDPYYQGYLLFIDSLQVQKPYRRQGIATALLEQVVKAARENNLTGLHLLFDARHPFPKSWYQKLGFKPTGWTEFEVHLSNLKL